MASRGAKWKRQQHCKYCDEIIPGGNCARHCKKQHPGVAHIERSKQLCNSELEKPKGVSGWLECCAVDLYICDVMWPLEKLNQLPDPHIQPRKAHDQCITWQIFRDERAARLPSLEMVLISLDSASCSDIWHLMSQSD